MLCCPGAAETESTDEAQDIEYAPGLEPGDRQDTEIQHRQVREQYDVVTGAGGGEYRCGEAAERGDDRKNHRVLHDSQECCECSDQEQEGKAGNRRKQWVQLHCGQRGQVQDTDTAALQYEAVIIRTLAPAPAKKDKCDTCRGHARISQPQWQPTLFCGVPQRKRQPQEEDDNADLDQRISAKDPALDENGKQRRLGPFRPGRWARCRPPGRVYDFTGWGFMCAWLWRLRWS